MVSGVVFVGRKASRIDKVSGRTVEEERKE